MEFTFRRASLLDIDFVIDTIIEAEKSGTNILSYSEIFEISENEVRNYLKLALEEEINGCELSISSFILAEMDKKIAGAVSVWLEGAEGLSSSVLKGNLLSYVMPNDLLMKAKMKAEYIKDAHIDYQVKTFQLGLVYVCEEFRGLQLAKKMIDFAIEMLNELYADIQKMQVQVFTNNTSAIKAYEKAGFKITTTKTSYHSKTPLFLPSNQKVLMELKLKCKAL